MILFSKDKGLIFKITNAILLIWFIGALVFVCNSIIEVILKEPKYTYIEYSATHCAYLDERTKLDEKDIAVECQRLYNSYLYSYKSDNHYKRKGLYMAIANVVIVAGAMYFINRKK